MFFCSFQIAFDFGIQFGEIDSNILEQRWSDFNIKPYLLNFRIDGAFVREKNEDVDVNGGVVHHCEIELDEDTENMLLVLKMLRPTRVNYSKAVKSLIVFPEVTLFMCECMLVFKKLLIVNFIYRIRKLIPCWRWIKQMKVHTLLR